MSERNKFYPLPDDYDTLTKDGKRKARLAVLTDQSTPVKLVQAWSFFRNVYLKPTGESFYRTGFQPSPPLHHELVGDLGAYARNAIAAPRGSAKSTVIGKEIPLLLLLTRPNFSIVELLATDGLVQTRFDDIMLQFQENPLIIEDFGLQKPKRGAATWNRHFLHLVNGSTLQGFSVIGRKRGARPRLLILDDPENDPDSESQSAQQILLEKFERILFRQIIPMLEFGSAVFWIGTLIHKRCFLYHACCSDDSRFKVWNRHIYEAVQIGPDGRFVPGSALWPAKWSEGRLRAKQEEMGESAFSAEYLNAPVSETERILPISPRANEYMVEGPPAVPDDPFYCGQLVKWSERKVTTSGGDAHFGSDLEHVYKEKECSYKDLVTPLFRILAFDYASGLTQHSDYSCIAVMGFDTLNNLWLLDMWMRRAKEAELLRQIYLYGLKWRVKVIGIESASIQIAFAEAAQDYISKQAPEEWHPRVLPVKYPANTSKASRIAGLEWRYRRGRIKYPAHLANVWPFNELYNQTRDFTTDLALLRFDDAIDTVAMSQYIVHSKPTPADKKVDPTKAPLAERIKNDTKICPGLPILSGIDPATLNPDEMDALLDRAYHFSEDKRLEAMRKRYRKRPITFRHWTRRR